jgi:hypothetical protein
MSEEKKKRAKDYNPPPFEGMNPSDYQPFENLVGMDVGILEVRYLTGRFVDENTKKAKNFLAIKTKIDGKVGYTQTGGEAVKTKMHNILLAEADEIAPNHFKLRDIVYMTPSWRTSLKTGQEYLDIE